jgi:Family of unknown function (DUF6011)
MSDKMTLEETWEQQRQQDKQRKQELRSLWASLTPQERAPLEEYLADRPDLDLNSASQTLLRSLFLIDLKGASNREEAGRTWLAKHRAGDRAKEANRAADEARRAEQKKRRAEASAVRRAAIDAAISRGEPVPAHLRPIGNRCAECRHLLRDPESVRLGIGPECRRRTPEKKDAA